MTNGIFVVYLYITKKKDMKNKELNRIKNILDYVFYELKRMEETSSVTISLSAIDSALEEIEKLDKVIKIKKK